MSDPTRDGQPRDTDASSSLTESEAKVLAGRGVIAGYAMALMNAFLAWYIYDTGYGVNEAAGDDRIVIAASTLFMALVAAALAYRFSRRHSIWIPIFFLAWVAFEVGWKLMTVRTTAGYIFIVGLVTFGLISGLRGALALRRARQAGLEKIER